MNSGWAPAATSPYAAGGRAEVEGWTSPALEQWLSPPSAALGPSAAPACAAPMVWPPDPSPRSDAPESMFGVTQQGFGQPQSSLSSMQEFLPSSGTAPDMGSNSPGVAWDPSCEPPHMPYISHDTGSHVTPEQSLRYSSSFGLPQQRPTFGSLSDASPRPAVATVLPQDPAPQATLPPFPVQTVDMQSNPSVPAVGSEDPVMSTSSNSLLWSMPQPRLGMHPHPPHQMGIPPRHTQTTASSVQVDGEAHPSSSHIRAFTSEPPYGIPETQAEGPGQNAAGSLAVQPHMKAPSSQAKMDTPSLCAQWQPQSSAVAPTKPATSLLGPNMDRPSLSSARPVSGSQAPILEPVHTTGMRGTSNASHQPPAQLMPQPSSVSNAQSISLPLLNAVPSSSPPPSGRPTPLIKPSSSAKPSSSVKSAAPAKLPSVMKSTTQPKLPSTKSTDQPRPAPLPKPKVKKTCQCASMTDKVSADKRVKCLLCKTEHIVLCNLIKGETLCVNCRPDKAPAPATDGKKRPAPLLPTARTAKKSPLPASSHAGIRVASPSGSGQPSSSALRHQAVRQLASAFAAVLGEGNSSLESSVLAAQSLDAAQRLESSLWTKVVLSRDSGAGASTMVGVAGHVKQRAAGLSASTSSVHALARQKAKVATYRDRLRIILVQLKNRRNTALREQINSGALTPEHLSELTPDQLASESMRSLIASTRKEKLASSVVQREVIVLDDLPEAENDRSRALSASPPRMRPVESLPNAPPKLSPRAAPPTKLTGLKPPVTKSSPMSALAPMKKGSSNKTTKRAMSSQPSTVKAPPKEVPAKPAPKLVPKQVSPVSLDRLLSAVNAPPPPKEQEAINKSRSDQVAASDRTKGFDAHDQEQNEVSFAGPDADVTKLDPPVRADIAALLDKLKTSMASLLNQTSGATQDGGAHPPIRKPHTSSAISVSQESEVDAPAGAPPASGAPDASTVISAKPDENGEAELSSRGPVPSDSATTKTTTTQQLTACSPSIDELLRRLA